MKMKSSSFTNDDELDAENGKLEKSRERGSRNGRVVKVNNPALLSGLAYCLSSCSMILVNKFVLSSYDFNAGISLMLYQVIDFLISTCSFNYVKKLLMLDSDTCV